VRAVRAESRVELRQDRKTVVRRLLVLAALGLAGFLGWTLVRSERAFRARIRRLEEEDARRFWLDER